MGRATTEGKRAATALDEEGRSEQQGDHPRGHAPPPGASEQRVAAAKQRHAAIMAAQLAGTAVGASEAGMAPAAVAPPERPQGNGKARAEGGGSSQGHAAAGAAAAAAAGAVANPADPPSVSARAQAGPSAEPPAQPALPPQGGRAAGRGRGGRGRGRGRGGAAGSSGQGGEQDLESWTGGLSEEEQLAMLLLTDGASEEEQLARALALSTREAAGGAQSPQAAARVTAVRRRR